MALALAAGMCLLLAACSTDGQPTAGMPDLAGRAVAAQDFPAGTASRVPDPAVAGALADITGASRTALPERCAPPPVIAGGAVVQVGPGGQDRTTYTAAVAYAGEHTLDELRAQLDGCTTWTTGTATAATTVRAEVLPAPPAPDGVSTLALRRTMETGGTQNALITSTVTLIGERDGIRVYVEYRWPSSGPLPPAAGTALDGLFDKAIAAAFG